MAETIAFLVEIQTKDESEKGIFGSNRTIKREEVSIDKLRVEMQKQTESLLSIAEGLPSRGGWTLGEFEVGVQITAEGGVNFIGFASAGASAALKLKFTRDN